MHILNIAPHGESRAEIMMYGVIGSEVEVSPFVSQVRSIKANNIDLRIHSNGGSVSDGWAIYEALRDHPAHVTAYVDGVAASMGSVIAMAANRIVMAKNAMMMIHDPVATLRGREDDLRRFADFLSVVKGQIRRAYSERSGIDEDEIAKMMDEETWMDAAEAVRLGFADEISGQEMKIAAHFETGYTPKTHKGKVSTMAEKTEAEVRAEFDAKFEAVKAESNAKVQEMSAKAEAAIAEAVEAKLQVEAMQAKVTEAETKAAEAEAKAQAAEEKAIEADTRLSALAKGLMGEDTQPAAAFKTAEEALDHYCETMDYDAALDKIVAEHKPLYDKWIHEATENNKHR